MQHLPICECKGSSLFLLNKLFGEKLQANLRFFLSALSKCPFQIEVQKFSLERARRYRIKQSTFLRISGESLIFCAVNEYIMIVSFDKEYLRERYEKGKADKKHRYQPEVIKRYKRGIDYLKSASKIEDLFLLPSLHYDVLKGDKAGISSIRVSDKYRIEFIVSSYEAETTIHICNILEPSNHYK